MNIPKVKQDNKGLTSTEVFKKLGIMWKALSDQDKEIYNKMHIEDVARRHSQLADIKKQGYFLMDDGKKSNEVVAKQKPGKKVTCCTNCAKIKAKLTKAEEKLEFTKRQLVSVKEEMKQKTRLAKEK